MEWRNSQYFPAESAFIKDFKHASSRSSSVEWLNLQSLCNNLKLSKYFPLRKQRLASLECFNSKAFTEGNHFAFPLTSSFECALESLGNKTYYKWSSEKRSRVCLLNIKSSSSQGNDFNDWMQAASFVKQIPYLSRKALSLMDANHFCLWMEMKMERSFSVLRMEGVSRIC